MTFQILSKNWIEDATITVSSGNTVKAAIKDRDVNTKWISVGSNDTITETLEFVWTTTRSIDHITLRGINLKQFIIQYWDGAAYVDFSTPINETINASTSKSYSFTLISTLRIRIQATATIAVNAQKQIGEFQTYYLHIEFDDSNLPLEHAPESDIMKHEHTKANGGNLLIFETTQPKWLCTYSWDVLSSTYFTLLEALRLRLSSFWVVPNSNDPLHQYYVNWTNTFNFRTVEAWDNLTLLQSYAGDMELKEV